MPKFLVDLWLDGYDSEEEMEEACEEFIYEQLNTTASSVKIVKVDIKENEKPDDDFDRKFKYFADIAKENDFISVWSMYDEVEDINDKHPFKEIIFVKYKGLVESVEGYTWFDLWKAANKLIERSGDYHHIFIENFKEIEKGIFSLVTGS